MQKCSSQGAAYEDVATKEEFEAKSEAVEDKEEEREAGDDTTIKNEDPLITTMKDGTQCVKGTTTKAKGAPPSHKRRWGDTPSNSGSTTPTGKATPRSEPESAQVAPPESPAPAQDAGNLDTTQGAAHARTKLNELAQQRQDPAQGEPSSLSPEQMELRRNSEERMNDPDQKSRSDAIRWNNPRDLIIYILKKYGYFEWEKA